MVNIHANFNNGCSYKIYLRYWHILKHVFAALFQFTVLCLVWGLCLVNRKVSLSVTTISLDRKHRGGRFCDKWSTRQRGAPANSPSDVIAWRTNGCKTVCTQHTKLGAHTSFDDQDSHLLLYLGYPRQRHSTGICTAAVCFISLKVHSVWHIWQQKHFLINTLNISLVVLCYWNW